MTNILNYTASFGGGYVMQNDGTFAGYLSSGQMYPGYNITSTSGNITATDLLTNDTVTFLTTQADVSSQPLASALN